MVFDLQAYRDEDLRALPYTERRERLAQLVDSNHTGLVLVPATADPAGARAWMRLQAPGIEGVAAKRCGHAYRPDLHVW